MTIANNFDEFVENVSEAERKALNMPAGQEMTQKLLEMKLAANPNMTPEEWQQTKSEFMTFFRRTFQARRPRRKSFCHARIPRYRPPSKACFCL